MRFYSFNPEKNEPINLQPYIVAIFLGGLAALLLIITGIGIMWIFKLFIKYWMWVVGFIVFIIIAKRFLSRKRYLVHGR